MASEHGAGGAQKHGRAQGARWPCPTSHVPLACIGQLYLSLGFQRSLGLLLGVSTFPLLLKNFWGLPMGFRIRPHCSPASKDLQDLALPRPLASDSLLPPPAGSQTKPCSFIRAARFCLKCQLLLLPMLSASSDSQARTSTYVPSVASVQPSAPTWESWAPSFAHVGSVGQEFQCSLAQWF